jgi:hypothetical protein
VFKKGLPIRSTTDRRQSDHPLIPIAATVPTPFNANIFFPIAAAGMAHRNLLTELTRTAGVASILNVKFVSAMRWQWQPAAAFVGL